MRVKESGDMLIERRQHKVNEKLWQQLTLSQCFSAKSLTNLGYHLTFIRSSEAGSFAVLIKGGYCTTVADNGDIDTKPVINVRT